MAEEGEVWEEIRDALHQLVEQGERQTTLLEKMAEQGKLMEKIARRSWIAAVQALAVAGLAIIMAVGLAYEGNPPLLLHVGVVLMLVLCVGAGYFAVGRGPR